MHEWKEARTFVMTDADGNVWDPTVGLPIPVLRPCTNAFSYLDHNAMAIEQGVAVDDAYKRLSRLLRLPPQTADGPVEILSRQLLLERLYSVALVSSPEALREWELSAAGAAGQALHDALATKDCSWITLQLAFNVLILLPPAASVTQHEVVGALLHDEEPAVLSYAAHALACMGPEAVAEHFEELMAIAGEGGECTPAAWLCICVLESEHLLRLKARGAPVCALLSKDAPFTTGDVTEGLLAGSNPSAAHHVFPQPQEVRTSLSSMQQASLGTDASSCEVLTPQQRILRGPIVQDGPSTMSSFVAATPTWSMATHCAFPLAARRRATELLLVGYVLSRTMALPLAVWVDCVMVHIVVRRSKPGGIGEGGKFEDVSELYMRE